MKRTARPKKSECDSRNGQDSNRELESLDAMLLELENAPVIPLHEEAWFQLGGLDVGVCDGRVLFGGGRPGLMTSRAAVHFCEERRGI